jgi:CRISPR-associated protein Csh1
MIQSILDLQDIEVQNLDIFTDQKNIIKNEKIDILAEEIPTDYKVILILLNENNYKYEDIKIEEVKDNGKKYLLITGGSGGTNYTPTAKLTELEKTLEKKIFKYFISKVNKLKNKSYAFINEINKELQEKKETIKNYIKNLINEKRNKKDKYLVTIAFQRDNNKILYLADLVNKDSINKDLNNFDQIIIEDFEKNLGKPEKAICFACNEYKNVYSKGFPIKFYTFDKLNYIAGGFKESDMYKNFPLCLDCIYKIRKGYNIIQKYFSFRIGKIDYYLIPSFVYANEQLRQELVNNFFNNLIKNKKDTLKQIKRITRDEREILYELSEQNSFIIYNFLFYEKDNNAFKIKMYIQSVLPSNIHKIQTSIEKALNKIEKLLSISIDFRLDDLREIVNDDEKIFLTLLNNIFTLKSIPKKVIFSNLVLFLQREWLNKLSSAILKKEEQRSKKELERIVNITFIFLLMLMYLNILKDYDNLALEKEEINMDNLSKINSLDNFFENFKEAFPNDLLKGIFLLGILTKYLLIYQLKNKGSIPFIKNIRNLKMNETDFKNLFRELENKLYEYEIAHKQDLQKLKEKISYYFLQAGANWKNKYPGLLNEELNYYFVLGMNLYDKIKETIEKEEENKK